MASYTGGMTRMSITTTPTFDAALERLMRRRGFANKSVAVRTAVEEAADLSEETPEDSKVALPPSRNVLEKS